ncbi:MAG: TetR/AcrR family transcriptional regulator [Treponema sp.]|jgi:AcrR family transcriptional regulator|uniref:TetR/AcrR family transcriptional regulator n=1 Tax=Treponema sp. TaxID=166 RepID=UPI002A911634|nr:TetR/AcrR family transcriptional regulator [Treponema sp.]MDY6396486.1 TetR/AcrR family transcriptional regulator [Treponema sp.]
MSGQVSETRKEKKDSRIQAIIECTFGLFSENGIENISMNDIAVASKIGVASLYRYFQTKEELAIEVAIYAWNLELSVFNEVFTSKKYEALSGYEQLKELLEVFADALVTQRSFFSFVYYFDSFIKKEKVSAEKLREYERTILGTNTIVVQALDKGIADGSISFSGSNNEVLSSASTQEMFITMMHSLFCLAQKLSISGDLLAMDEIVGARKQIEILINMLLVSLKN